MSALIDSPAHDDLYFVSQSGQRGDAIPELSRVALTEQIVTADGEILPLRLVGTIVGVWGGGEAYDIEFTDPIEALVTVDAKVVRPV